MKTGSLNVLVADKTQSVLDSARRSLESSGFTVATTLSGTEAVEMARENDFDVVLVDYHTPGTPGLGVLAELRQLQPRCIRILMVTSLSSDMAVSAINSGDVSRVIVKPFHAASLRQAVTDATLQQQKMGEHLATLRTSERKWQREALNECLAKDLLQIALQPIVSAQDRSVWAYEGLLRSTHERLKTPGEIFEIAENLKLIRNVTARSAFLASKRLEKMPADALFFLNFHADEMTRPETFEQYLKPLLPFASRVALEISERRAAGEQDWQWFKATQSLRALGFKLAVDDLGAGQNSLSVLAELEPEIIKVDMSIVRDIDERPSKRRLMEIVAKFASGIGAKVVAEGTETEAEAKACIEAGVTHLQGFLFGHPTV